MDPFYENNARINPESQVTSIQRLSRYNCDAGA